MKEIKHTIATLIGICKCSLTLDCNVLVILTFVLYRLAGIMREKFWDF